MAVLGVRVEVSPGGLPADRATIDGIERLRRVEQGEPVTVSAADLSRTEFCTKPLCVEEALPGSAFCRRHESITDLRARLERERGNDALETMDNGQPQPVAALAEPDEGRGESRSEATPVTASVPSGSASASTEEKNMVDVALPSIRTHGPAVTWTPEKIIAAPPGGVLERLRLTGDFAAEAQRIRQEATVLRTQADALDVIAAGVDQLAETGA